jgi:hypothetical protein
VNGRTEPEPTKVQDVDDGNAPSCRRTTRQPEKAAMSTPVPDRLVRLQMHLNLAVQYALLFGVVLGLSQFLQPWVRRLHERSA